MRLVGAVGARINVRSSILTMVANSDLDSNPGSHSCKRSDLATELSHYPYMYIIF